MRHIILMIVITTSLVITATAQKQGSINSEHLDAKTKMGPTPPQGTFMGFTNGAHDNSAAILIVPAYIWRNGCSPTSGSMVLGYWDHQKGFEDLVPGNASQQTQAVDQVISSDGNYLDYCIPIDEPHDIKPDLSEPPIWDEHPDNCVADFMNTSQSFHNLHYGSTRIYFIDDGLRDYVKHAAPHYDATAKNLDWPSLTWNLFRSEIDALRPMVLHVDVDGDNEVDHSVAAIGYDDQGSVPLYACYNTWDKSKHWYEFAGMAKGQEWGIHSATFFNLEISKCFVVPDDFSTIQAAIDAAPNGNIILVRPGKYKESINFKGKSITLRSDVDGDPMTYDISPKTTIIDNNQGPNVVVFINNEGPDAVLDGFTLTNAYNMNANTGGGGVRCYQSLPTIKNNIITGNFVLDYGGGILCEYGAHPKIINNTITNNWALNWGGGLHIRDASNPTVSQNKITKNRGDLEGGGIYIHNAFPKIYNNIIYDNSSYDGGGGLYCVGATNSEITNNTIYGNSCSKGGGIYCLLCLPPILNNIIWNNGAKPLYFDSCSPKVEYCLVQGGWPGTGNIADNPLLCSPANGNFHILEGSPCIDAGTNDNCPDTDFEGDVRPIDGNNDYIAMTDIGCDEFRVMKVPIDYVTIQGAIDDLTDGRIVLVYPGTYKENINFYGKGIVLKSKYGPQNTIIDGNQTGSVVTFENAEGADSMIDGFTLTNGYDNLMFGSGGINCDSASPTIQNNIISGNTGLDGGGIYCQNNSHPKICNNQVKDNWTLTGGGGIYCNNNSDAIITNNVISENQANDVGGGGIYAYQSSPTITNNVIFLNDSGNGDGGGILCEQNASPIISNNTIYGNVCSSAGGIQCLKSEPNITNNIIWNNANQQINLVSCSPLITFCDIQGGWTGVGNINEDPLFADPQNEDFHLMAHSPCINRGANDGADLEDMDGDQRPFMGLVDMGADEYVDSHLFEVDKFTISEVTGGVVQLMLKAGASHGNRPYVVFSSVTGTGPGAPLPGSEAILRINWDVVTTILLGLANGKMCVNFVSSLNGMGENVASLNTLGPIPSGSAGLRLYFAYALYNPWNMVSNPVAIEIVP